MIVNVQVNSKVAWQVGQTDAGHWLAVCAPLRLTMEGDTVEDLMENTGHAVALLLADLLESGELDAFLRKQGWQATVPQHVPLPDVQFHAPIPLLVHPGRGSANQLLQQVA